MSIFLKCNNFERNKEPELVQLVVNRDFKSFFLTRDHVREAFYKRLKG